MMYNPFKRMETEREVPKLLKKKVMDNVESVKLIMDLTGLFSANYASAIEEFFRLGIKR